MSAWGGSHPPLATPSQGQRATRQPYPIGRFPFSNCFSLPGLPAIVLGMKERHKTERPVVVKSAPHRLLVLSFQNPLLRALCWLFFLVAIIRLSYVGSRGLPLPEVGDRAEFYYVTPRPLVCQKPNPNFDALVERATAQVSPIYVNNPAWLEERLQQIRSVQNQLESDLETLKELRKRQGQVPAPKVQEGVKNSPFYAGAPKEAGRADLGQRGTDLTKEAVERQIQTTRDSVSRYLLGLAPGLTRNEVLNLLKAFENSPENVADTFHALEMALGQVASWYIVETSTLEFQQDRAKGITLAGTPPTPLPVESLRTVAETIDHLQSRSVPQVLNTRFARLRGQRSISAFVTRSAAASIRPTLVRDQASTQDAVTAALARVPEMVPVEFSSGQSVLSLGETVSDWQRDCVAAMTRQSQAGSDTRTALGMPVAVARILVGIALLVVLAALALRSFSVKVFPDRLLEGKDAVAIGVLLTIHLALVRLALFLTDLLAVAYPSLSPGVVMAACPVGLTAAMLQILLGARVSLLGVLFLFLPTALIAQQSGIDLFGGDYPLYFSFFTLAASLSGIWVTRRVTVRGAFVVAGLATAVVGAAWWAIAWLLEGGLVSTSVALQLLTASLLSGAITYVFLISLTPIFEYAWDYTTTSRLLELASTDHSALKELSRRAPGTYQHSMFIATLVEDAAQAVGANALLARVGAYYHDLGKLAALEEREDKKGMDSPLYFAENQGATANPHDRLDPWQSAAILRRHVAQSIRIIKKYRLGRRIMDIAAQHHGTCLMEHFYAKAVSHAQNAGKNVDDGDFRYPGPRPQSKESALVMLADSVEAAVRALTEHDEESITARVRGIIAKRVDDGQLDDSGLTYGDVKAIERSFTKTLFSMYHARPKYLEVKQESTTIRLSKNEVENLDDEITSDMQRLEKVRIASTTKDLGRPLAGDVVRTPSSEPGRKAITEPGKPSSAPTATTRSPQQQDAPRTQVGAGESRLDDVPPQSPQGD